MDRAYIYMLLVLSGVSLYSADKDIQQLSDTKTCPHIIVHEGISAVHTDIYTKLLGISRTLQDQVNDFGKLPPLQNKPYYTVNRNIESLQYIVNFISAQNTYAYLRRLSLIKLIQLYQEADFWAVDAHILDTIRNSIIDQLRNADTLTWLLSSKENLSHFISACNTVTLDTLTRALHSYTPNMLWYTTQTLALAGHINWVNSIAVHIDGTLFSGSGDKTVRVWKKDAQGTYHCVQTLTGHTKWINSVILHPNGTLFSCSNDCTICVWKKDAQGKYKCVHTLTGHTQPVNTVAVHTDGTLFSGSVDKTVRVWKKDAQGVYHCVQTLTGHNKQVNSIAVHIDGTLFSGSGKTIRVWKQDVQGAYQCIQTLTGHTHPIMTLAVHADGTLFSGSSDCTIRVWKTDAKGHYHCVQTLTGHTHPITTLAVHIDDTLFSGSSDCTIRVWKTDAQGTYQCVQTLTNQTDRGIRTLAVHTDGTLFSGSLDNTICVWKPLQEHLSLEQHLLFHWIYNMYQFNNNTQINTLPTHMMDTYDTLPQSIKNNIIQWYKPEHVPNNISTSIQEEKSITRKPPHLFSKIQFWTTAGILAGCTALGTYLYYKWFKK